jgi:hypothetical protein
VIGFRTLLLLVFIPMGFTYADHCDESVALLGSEFGASDEVPRDSAALLGNAPDRFSHREPISREALLKEMASLYEAALQNPALMQAFDNRLHQVAMNEGLSTSALYEEIEVLAAPPKDNKKNQAERAAIRTREQAYLVKGLQPYLARLKPKQREVIEKELLIPGLISPLSTGEVGFEFQGRHRFLVGNEGLFGEDRGATKKVSFGPKDGFIIGQVPVTQFMYFLAALGEGRRDPTPSSSSLSSDDEYEVELHLEHEVYYFNPNQPVHDVSQREAKAHAAHVSEILGVAHSLPSEIQWEFANRAGSSASYHFGDDPDALLQYGWFSKNSALQLHDVGMLMPNPFHLYDTHGNVSEWTSDRRKTVFGVLPINRGGGYYDDAVDIRSAHRSAVRGGNGFRLVRQTSTIMQPYRTFTLGAEPRAGKNRARPRK